MRRRRSSFRKEKAIMLASSCLVLTALTVTGLYVRNQRKELPEENVVDFTALEEEESLTMLGSRTGDGAQDGENVPAGGQGEGTAAEAGESADAAELAGADGQADAAGVAEAGESADAAELAGADGQADAAELAGAGESADAAELARADEPAAAASAQEAAAADSGSAGEALAASASDAIAGEAASPGEDTDAMSVTSLLDFTDADTLVWPIVGNVLVNYSMDKTVYFATLDQYKYSPAIVIAAVEGEGITAAADGQVTDIYQDPETGTTVVMNLGDGYELTYGQLKDLAVSEGDMVETGDLIGSVAAPTMYYSVEGANVYFKLTKDGTPVDPMSRLG
ncbi:MAG TPA: M23 family metallopeptidase [Candidatus Eisenbergiella pullistercoris]|uniref:M23 family metallopeptidase n=1 Tax=Candidatus Eisenbergiella pullistercoris TaxID=2838555 RepID=A0A9D2C6K1_9FIRM|nr:M23 family metallopeptidase [Candidatus Eisenbergiella pullistercoris]